jgi:glycosyltransferase involved in cell wall biosynthesis
MTDIAELPVASTLTKRGRRPKVSIAISTYQRAHLLPRLFAALAAQTMPRSEFEVIIVDNGSTDDTRLVLPRLIDEHDLRVHAVRIEPNRGPAVSRNVAWRHARAEFVAFTDDDCAPTPAWLEHGLAAMRTSDTVVVGRTLPDPEMDLGPFSRTVFSLEPYWLPTCNVFYRRSDLEAVGGFDEAFYKPGNEDTDLGYRVKHLCGREFRFVNDALVYHDVRSSNFIDAAKETQRWSNAARFFAKFPEGRTHLHRGIFWKASHPKAILAAVGLLLGLRRPRYLALVLPWLHYRTRVRPPLGTGPKRYAALPGVLVVDLAEVVSMARGAVRYRTPVL